jgi:hypothetical protein
MLQSALTAELARVAAATPSPARAVISTTPMLRAVIVLRLGRGGCFARRRETERRGRAAGGHDAKVGRD